MEFTTFVYAYFGVTAILVFILLFGEAPQLRKTPLPHLHWAVTVGWAVALE
jgi:hypothetical protein